MAGRRHVRGSDAAAEQARFDARETVHAGPMFGRKTFAAEVLPRA